MSDSAKRPGSPWLSLGGQPTDRPKGEASAFAASIEAAWREIDFSVFADVPHLIDNRGTVRHAAEGHAAPIAIDLSAFDSLTFDDPAKDGPE